MNTRACALLLSFVAAAAWALPGRAGEELKIVTAGSVTAHFSGTRPESDMAPRFGVEKLWFSFEGDPKRYDFAPSGTLFFSDWRFGIFSSGG